MPTTARLIITREHEAKDPEDAADAFGARHQGREDEERRRQGRGGRADAICVHSDTPNAVAIAVAVRDAVKPYLDAT